MATVLSNSAQFQCPHASPITPPTGPALTISGSAACVKGTFTLTGACPAVTNTNTGTIQCTTISSTGGESTALTVGGKAALLSSIVLSSDGAMPSTPGNCTVSAESPAPLTAS